MPQMKRKAPQWAEALGHDATDKRIDILRRLDAAGSISEAARGAGVSYKAAWQAIETLSNLAAAVLVEKAVGGAGGGGAQLTPAGHRLLRTFDRLLETRQQVLAQLDFEERGTPRMPGLAALGLRTSMRNHLPCAVAALTPHGLVVRVALALSDGNTLFSRITHESAQLLDLRPGHPVLALCKATAVQVGAAFKNKAGWNALAGRIVRVADDDAAGGEVGLELPCGLRLVGFAKPVAGLRVGDPAMASVEETGVVIAVSG